MFLALASVRYLLFMHRSFGNIVGGSNAFIAELCFVFEALGLDKFFIGILMAGIPLPHWTRESRLTGLMVRNSSELD